MKWAMSMKEVLISRLNDEISIIPTDMNGETHHAWKEVKDVDIIIVEYNTSISHIKNGNVCIRGNRLVIDIEIIHGREKCLVIKVIDTFGE